MKKSVSLLAFVLPLVLSACKPDSGPAGDNGSTTLSEEEKVAYQPVTSKATPDQEAVATKWNPKEYGIDSKEGFDPKDIAKYQKQSPDTPAILQGVWWMNGNPLSDETVSFANLKFSDKNGRKVGYFPVFGDNNYTFHAHLGGKNLYEMAKKLNLVYEVSFSSDFKEGTIVPTLKIGRLNLRVPPSLIDFRIVWKEEGYYIRESSFLKIPLLPYYFMRIIDKDGKIVDVGDGRWEQFLDHSPRLMLPRKL